MDPNQFQFQENFENVRTKKNASYYRMRARQFLTEKYWMALGVYVVASLLGGASSSVNVNVSLPVGDSNMVALIIVAVFAVLTSLAAAIFLSGTIRTGYARYNLGLADGRKPGFEDLFYYFKSGQYLRTVRLGGLCLLIETAAVIPAVLFTALMILFGNPLTVGGSAFGVSSDVLLAFGLLVTFVLAIVGFVFVIIVQYRYYFAHHILADNPDVTASDALRQSAALMKGRKWKLFCLHLSFIGWLLLGSLACGLGVIFVSPYMSAADVAFYDEISQRSKVEKNEFPSLDPEDYDPNLAQW